MANSSSNDPFGLIDQLRLALARPELSAYALLSSPVESVGDAAKEAALQLAIALGRCRLFGADTEEAAQGALPTGVAVDAARQLECELEGWTCEAKVLAEDLDRCEDLIEIHSLCCEKLENAMDAWASFLAIDEAYQLDLEQGAGGLSTFGEVLDSCLERLEIFHAGLREQSEHLALAAETELLENWRKMLADEFKQALPWWLNGTLEQVLIQRDQEMGSAFPSLALSDVLREAWNWLPKPVLTMAAAKPGEAYTPTVRCWRSPDQQLLACLTASPGQTQLRLNFLRDGESTTELQGKIVSLANLNSLVDEQGHALFSVADLGQSAAEQLPKLVVEGEVWVGPSEEPFQELK